MNRRARQEATGRVRFGLRWLVMLLVLIGWAPCADAALTDEQRQVVVLKFLEGMDNAEVSKITGKTVGAVKALQHRGLEALRAQLVTPQEPMPVGLGWERAHVPSLG